MGRRVTVAYESAARERAARKKSKLRWHRSSNGGLVSKGARGEYCIVRQRPDRRRGIYRWGVTHAGHSIGSTENLSAAKGLAVHHEFRQACEAPAVPALEEHRNDSYDAQVAHCFKAMGRHHPEADVEKAKVEIARIQSTGVPPNVAAAIIDATIHHAHPPHTVMTEGAREEAPTKGEWEVIVTHPPREHRGHILAMAGPGYGHSEGDKIYLTGFYDDEEARHVANSISRKYGPRYGTSVTFGPRRSMAAEDSHPGTVAEERLRPGANRNFLRKKGGEPCHDCVDGSCKPFTKLERDPEALEACMALGREVGVLDTSRKLYDLVKGDIEKRDREVFLVICLDFRGQLRDYVELSIGQRHRVAVDIEDILAVVLLSGCDGFVVAHCHPSGHAEPSQADKALTKSIEKAAAVATPNVKFVDHIVVGLGQYYSFADRKLHKVR